MNCKACNTRLSSGQKACPQCGRAVNVRAGVARKAVAAVKRPLSASRDEGIELELRDETIPPRPAKSKAVGKPKAARARGEGHVAVRTPIALQPSDMRSLLADQPDLLEEDLCIYTDEKGKTVGVDFGTDVGDIDLLAEDGDESLVVVMVAEASAGHALVGEVLQRIGWVRKHVANGMLVRGIVLLDRVPEDLSYAAAAVADTVSFRTYRIALKFDEVEL